MPKSRFPLACLLTSILLICCGQVAAIEPDYSDAVFSVPADPTRAVLHVTITSMDMIVRSLTLYGDGRVELTHNVDGESELQLEFQDVESVLEGAVRHGLAEYDAMAVRARKLTLREGKPLPGSLDGPNVLVLLSVDGYKRGGYSAPTVERKITMKGPRLSARFFPEIPQFQGVVDLVDWTVSKFEDAKTQQGAE